MARKGINKVILIGNLGVDPEMRYTNKGSAVANLRIATNESWRNRDSGETQERTEWHRVVMFDKLGEIAGEYLRKGSQVYVEGRLQTRKWQDQQGNDRYSTEIVANEMQMLGARGDSDSAAPAAPSASRGAPASEEGGRSQAPQARQGESATASASDFDDDIPF